MQFRSPVNEPTFHLFSWVTRGGGATALPGLIAKAFDQVEEGDWSSKENVSTAACEKLADLLEAHLLDYLSEGGRIGDVDESDESPTRPLVVRLRQINFRAAAIALLISVKERARTG